MVKYREFLPHAALQESVKRFWTLEREYTPAHPTDEIVPDDCVELIFHFGSPYVLERGGLRRQLPPVYLVGRQDRTMTLRSTGLVRLVAVRFHAWGLLPFLDLDAAPGRTALTLDADWRALAERLRVQAEAGCADRAVKLLEDFLIGRRQTMLYEPRQTPMSASLLYHTRGQFRIAELAAASMRRLSGLTRESAETVGGVRFERIRARLLADPDVPLTDLAREFDFADQSHLINDFKTFTGKTPGDFAAAMRAFQSVLRDHDNVVFLHAPPVPEFATAAS